VSKYFSPLLSSGRPEESKNPTSQSIWMTYKSLDSDAAHGNETRPGSLSLSSARNESEGIDRNLGGVGAAQKPRQFHYSTVSIWKSN
jgi:hypothetical protein